jgi:hypothetical protein
MHPIEDDLKAALRRKPAPEGFSRRVLNRIEHGGPLRTSPSRSFRQWRWMLAAAAMIVLMASTGLIQYRQYIRTRNDAALHQTLSALSIAAEQLDLAKARAFEALPAIQVENRK